VLNLPVPVKPLSRLLRCSGSMCAVQHCSSSEPGAPHAERAEAAAF
jgi:hypothetical protein